MALVFRIVAASALLALSPAAAQAPDAPRAARVSAVAPLEAAAEDAGADEARRALGAAAVLYLLEWSRR